MPHFSIDTIPLSPMQKRELINGIKELYADITGIDKSQISITLNEVPAENMGISNSSSSSLNETSFKNSNAEKSPFGENPFSDNPFGENPFKKKQGFYADNGGFDSYNDANSDDVSDNFDYEPTTSIFSKKKADFNNLSFEREEEEEVSAIYKEKKPKKMLSFLKEIFPK